MQKKNFINHLRETGIKKPEQLFPVNMQEWFSIEPNSEAICISSVRYNAQKISITADKKANIPLI